MKPALSERAFALSIDIQQQSPLWSSQPMAEETVRAAIAAARAALSTAEGELSILLTDDSTICKLNRDWRGIDKSTNVLSFPGAKTNSGPKLLGDIVIAYETLARECDEEGRVFLHHLAHLTVHGFLHLVGYDHQSEPQAEEMEALESKIMMQLKMPDPYVGRDLDCA